MDYKPEFITKENSVTQNSDILSLVLKLSQEELMRYKSPERQRPKIAKKGDMLELLRQNSKNITY